VLVVQNARALERLHGRDVALTDVHESGLRIGCGGCASAEAVAGVEFLALDPQAALLLCFIIQIDRITLGGSEGLGYFRAIDAGDFFRNPVTPSGVGPLCPVDIVADDNRRAGRPTAMR